MPPKKAKGGMGSRAAAKRMKYTGRTKSKANKTGSMKRRIALKGTGNPNVMRAGTKKLQPWEKATAKRDKASKAAGIQAYGGDDVEQDNPYLEEDLVVSKNQKKLHEWIQSDKQARSDAKAIKGSKNKFKNPELMAAKEEQRAAQAAAVASMKAPKGKGKVAQKRPLADKAKNATQPPPAKRAKTAVAKAPTPAVPAAPVMDEMAIAMARLTGKALPEGVKSAQDAATYDDYYVAGESDSEEFGDDDDFLGVEEEEEEGENEEAEEDVEIGDDAAAAAAADDTAQPLQEGRSATLHGSFAPLQRIRGGKKKRAAPAKRGEDSDSDVELPADDDDAEEDEDEGKPKLKSKPEFTSFSQLNKSVAKPVFGEVAQAPPKLQLPTDKRSLMPAHIKKKKMQEMMERLVAGGPAELPAPKLEEAGARAGPNFTAMQQAARDSYAMYKAREKKKVAAALAASQKPVSRAARRKMNVNDHTQEVSDFV